MMILPYEVSSRILSSLSVKDSIQLAQTCKFWNKFLLHGWPSGTWHII